MGADGGIGGTYGVMPELFCSLDKLYRANEIEKAQKLQFEINSVIKKLLSYPSLYGACKYILSLRNIETGAPRLPLLPVAQQDHASLAELNNTIQALINTYTKEVEKVS